MKPRNWKAFYADQINDPPLREIVEIINVLWRNGAKIIYCTGRPSEYRQVTQQWIYKHVLAPPLHLYMRPEKDNRRDDEVKRDLLYQMRKDGLNPTLVFEDRKRIVDMWRSEGLICVHVAEGEF